jgi:curli biogenesis system outer membrane secretion channel CsgG
MFHRTFSPFARALALVSSIALSAGLFSAPSASAQDADLRYTVMVSEFENQSNFGGRLELGHAWGTILTDQLNQTGRFIVISEPGMRQAAVKEQSAAAAGLTAQGNRAPERGQLTPAQLLVKGVITRFQQEASGNKGGLRFRGIGLGRKKETAEINVTLQLVDSTTGMVIASRSVVGESTDKKMSISIHRGGIAGSQEITKNENVQKAVTAAVAEAVDWMIGQLDQIPWRGSVVLVEDGSVYINRGAREGVAEGQRFAVGESKLIRDPSTGEVLDEIVTERARIEAVRVRDKVSICRVTSGDASTLYEGMGVTPASTVSTVASTSR